MNRLINLYKIEKAVLLFVAVWGWQNLLSATTPQQTIDSLRQVLIHQKGEDKLKTLEEIYNQSLIIGDFQGQLKCLDEWQDEAHRQKNAANEAEARVDRILDYFNEAIYDSVFPLANSMMAFSEEHGMVRKKMQAWHMLVGAYHFTGQYNQALREVKLMYEEARQLDSEYGESMAYFNMGNVYYTMNHYEESADAFEKSIPLMRNIDKAVLLEIYPYYCDALEAIKKYEKLDSVTRQWWQIIDEKFGRGDMRDKSSILANYYIACAQAKLGKNKLYEAENYLDEVAKNVEGKNSYEYLFYLFYRAKLRMLQGRYQEALDLNAERIEMCSVIDDKPTLIPVHKQRAEILMRAQRYKEAAEMYARTLALSDSLNRANTRTQLNELRTIFKVDELESTNALRENQLEEMEIRNALQRSRFMTIITTLAALALLIVMLIVFFAARRLKNKNRELAQRNNELKVASEHAEASLKMKTDFIHQISHEIRTPLNVLSGFSQILTAKNDPLDAATRQSINHRIVESTDRITNLVNKMLELSEANSETTIECKDDVTPEIIANEAIEQSGIRTAEKTDFECCIADDIKNVAMHSNLKQATRTIHFLLGNARKFMQPAGEDLRQGTIRLLVSQTNDKQFVQFVVEDTGIGVPAEEAEHIFDEFVQLNEYYEGAGIGLTVARSIARRLGGDVVLDTSYTQGARFVFTLPIFI